MSTKRETGFSPLNPTGRRRLGTTITHPEGNKTTEGVEGFHENRGIKKEEKLNICNKTS